MITKKASYRIPVFFSSSRKANNPWTGDFKAIRCAQSFFRVVCGTEDPAFLSPLSPLPSPLSPLPSPWSRVAARCIISSSEFRPPQLRIPYSSKCVYSDRSPYRGLCSASRHLVVESESPTTLAPSLITLPTMRRRADT